MEIELQAIGWGVIITIIIVVIVGIVISTPRYLTVNGETYKIEQKKAHTYITNVNGKEVPKEVLIILGGN